MKKIIAVFILMLTIVGCGFQKTEESANETPKNACSSKHDNSSDRESALKVLGFDAKIITLEEAERKLKYTGAFFFSLEDCPWCYDALKALEDVYEKHRYDAETFYVHVQKEEMAEENPVYKNVKEFLNISDEMFVPYFVVVEDGEILGYNIGTVKQHVEENGVVPEMNEQQIQVLQAIYDSLYKKLKTCRCDDSLPTSGQNNHLPVADEGDFTVHLRQAMSEADKNVYVDISSDSNTDRYTYTLTYVSGGETHTTSVYDNNGNKYSNDTYTIAVEGLDCTYHADESDLAIDDGAIMYLTVTNSNTNEVILSNSIEFNR